MAFEILTYSPGVARQSAPEDRTANVAAALSDIAQVASRKSYQDTLIADRESKRAALNDIAQNAVDPLRREKEMAYGATVLRNEIMENYNAKLTELENPASELSMMNPDDFRKLLDGEVSDFYRRNQEAKHADVLAEVFSQYTLKNTPALLAKQASSYKAAQKNAQQQQAIIALGSMPEMTPEAFNANTEELMSKVFPAGMFTTDEKMALSMASAVNSARRGDRRLLDYLNNKWQVEEIMPREFLLAEKVYQEYEDQMTRNHWNETYRHYADLSREGMFTKELYDEVILDSESIDNLGGRSKIDSWYEQSERNRVQGLKRMDGYERFMNADPVVGYSAQEFTELSQDIYNHLMQQHADNPIEGLEKWAQLLAVQGQIDGTAKEIFATGLGRSIIDPEIAKSEAFELYYTIAAVMDEHMTREQHRRQLGDDAYYNYRLIKDEMEFSGHTDFGRAVESVANMLHQREQRGQGNRLSTDEHRLIGEGVEDILRGNFDTSDPHATKLFGIVGKGRHALITGPISTDVQNMASHLVMKGFRPDRAVEIASETVAGRYSFLGGGLIFTGEAGPNAALGFPPGTSPKDRDRALDDFAESLGLKAKELNFIMAGDFMYPVGQDGTEYPRIPTSFLADTWLLKQQEEANRDHEANVEKNALRHQKMDEDFLSWQYSMHGIESGDAQLWEGSPYTIADFERADAEERIKMRRQFFNHYNEGSRRIYASIRKILGRGEDIDPMTFDFSGIPGLRPPTDVPVETMPEDIAPMAASVSIDEATATPANQSTQTPVENPNTFQPQHVYIQTGTGVVFNEKYRPYNLQSQLGKMGLSPLEKDLVSHEGAIATQYLCTADAVTIGVGRNLNSNPFDAEEIKQLGKDRNFNEKPLTAEEAVWLMRRDIARIKTAAPRAFPKFNKMSANRQSAIIQLMFSMGTSFHLPRPTGSGFVGFAKAVNEGRWDDAGLELLYQDPRTYPRENTKWVKDVGANRASSIIKLISEG